MIYEIETIKIKYKIKEKEGSKIRTSEVAAELLIQIYNGLDVDQEHFCILALNADNRVTGYKIIASGGQNTAMVDPKIIFRSALLLGAIAIIISHNHPSGNKQPSQNDITLYNTLKVIAEKIDIKILDNIIIAGNSFYSFTEEGEK